VHLSPYWRNYPTLFRPEIAARDLLAGFAAARDSSRTVPRIIPAQVKVHRARVLGVAQVDGEIRGTRRCRWISESEKWILASDERSKERRAGQFVFRYVLTLFSAINRISATRFLCGHPMCIDVWTVDRGSLLCTSSSSMFVPNAPVIFNVLVRFSDRGIRGDKRRDGGANRAEIRFYSLRERNWRWRGLLSIFDFRLRREPALTRDSFISRRRSVEKL